MKIQLDAYLTSEKMPEPFVPVNIRGGEAIYNGDHRWFWTSKHHAEQFRQVIHHVRWWYPVVNVEDISELVAPEPHETL